MRSRFRGRAALAVWVLALAACAAPGGNPASGTSTILPATTAATLTAPAPATLALANTAPAEPLTPTVTPQTLRARLTSTPAATLAPASPAPRPGLITVLAENLPAPDDLALGPDGSLYVSDAVDGTVRRRSLGGGWQLVVSGLHEPEGMVFLPDGSLLIAEQGRNRLVRYSPSDHGLQPFFTLKNITGQAGIDGIALDSQPPASVIVPDSPNGTVLRVGGDGQTVSIVARGFARPTSAWVEAGGAILVTSENDGALSRVYLDGRVDKLATLPVPDDVIEDGAGDIFVSTIGDGAVHLIAAGAQEDTVLIKGLSSPQGLLLDAGGNLMVTDPGHHRIIQIKLH